MRVDVYVTVFRGGASFVQSVPPSTPSGGTTYRVEVDVPVPE